MPPTFQTNPSPSAGGFAPPSPVSSKKLKGNNDPSGITFLTMPVRTEGAHTSALKSQSSAWMVVATKWMFLEAKTTSIEGKNTKPPAILGEGISLGKLHEVYVSDFTSEDVWPLSDLKTMTGCVGFHRGQTIAAWAEPRTAITPRSFESSAAWSHVLQFSKRDFEQ